MNLDSTPNKWRKSAARDAAPKGWVLKVHKYCNGVRCYVRRPRWTCSAT
jgi:hypothetical protein